MTTSLYVLIVSATYEATFMALFFILHSWPPRSAYEVPLLVIGGAVNMEWAGTERGQQIIGADRGQFTAVSFLHAGLIANLLGGVIYIRFGPGGSTL